jgi:hypothetical protein
VTREDFRRELGDAFDSISGSPSPALPDRVRAALVEAPERRGPVWIAALAAAVIAVVLVGVLLVGNPLGRLNVPGAHATVSPSATPATTPSPNPTPTPTPTGTPVAVQYDCSGAPFVIVARQSVPPLAYVDAVRTGTHTGYDRLTIEFQNGQPTSIELRPQSNAKFTKSPSGLAVTLSGKDGILITIKGSDAHTAYSGSTDIKTGYTGLLEVRQVQDFEGTVQWGLGLSAPACYKATILTNPVRLVIDIQTS